MCQQIDYAAILIVRDVAFWVLFHISPTTTFFPPPLLKKILKHKNFHNFLSLYDFVDYNYAHLGV